MARWDKLSSRGQVEDRRGIDPVAIGGLSFTGIAIVLLVNLLGSGDAGDILNQLDQVAVETQIPVDQGEFTGEDPYEVFASTVLGSNNQLWESRFSETNLDYSEPTLVLFRGATESGCGIASSQVGPHYCPLDTTIYLDETFFDELTSRFGARGGDVAEAYVIGHEVAHHVQYQLGIMDQVQAARQRGAPDANELSIKLELQADCLAGVWANSIRDQGVLLPGEIREAMDAAAAVGDDRIQESLNSQVNPESWTHGSSDERVSWFNRGFETGNMNTCDTFN